jgi:TolB-like protein/Tfp pilus assembly protein PilF
MSTLFEELKRRNVFRVAIAYIIVGWVVMQVAEFLSPLLRLPEWTVSMALYVGILGFPFALLFTWAFELTPDGIKRSHEVHPDESISHETGAWLNRLMLALMAVVIVGLLADRFMSSQPEQAIDHSPVIEVEGAPGPAGSAAEAGPARAKSIAVLPFVNMSNDPEQEYFSDGISEELLNALANIRELRVAARTSSFAFKGKEQNISIIGDQLKVETVLEGSVRKSGKRLRITAQLINVEDGYHLWSETYDRDLTDIFVIQDEISAAIVEALRVHLAGAESLQDSKVVDVEAYNHYLLARHNLRLRTTRSLTLAVKKYQQAIDIDPGYAAAWAGKALATNLLSDRNYGEVPMLEALQQSQMMLDMAFSLDAKLGSAHAAQALLLQARERPEESLVSLERAIDALPSEGILYSWKYLALIELGRFDQAQEALEKAYDIDPLHPAIRGNLSRVYVDLREDSAARALTTPGTASAYELEAQISLRDGLYAAAIATLRQSVDLAEKGQDTIPRFALRLTYFYSLNNPELAASDAPEEWILAQQSRLDPEAALARLRQIPDVGGRNTTLGALVISLIQLEQFEEALIALEPKRFGERPVHGYMFAGTSDIWLAYMQAYSQKQLGMEKAAMAMAGKVQRFIEAAVANDRQGDRGDHFNLLAAVQSLRGQEDAALASLELAWDHFNLDWTDLRAPWYRSLHKRAEFRDLKARMQSHLNAERAKLGWEPVAI